MHTDNPRRLLLQAMATGLTQAPARWLTPVVAAVTLPAHAQTSEECNTDGQVVLGSCSGFTSCTGGVTVVGEQIDCDGPGTTETNINTERCLEQRFRVIGEINGATIDVEVVASQIAASSGPLTEEPILSEQQILQAALESACSDGPLPEVDTVLSGGGTPELIDECTDTVVVDISEAGEIFGELSDWENHLVGCGTVRVTIPIFLSYRSQFTLTVDG